MLFTSSRYITLSNPAELPDSIPAHNNNNNNNNNKKHHRSW